MLPRMWCPYCGDEMRQGYVRLRGQWAAWAGVLAVNFEAGDDSGEGSELLPRTLFRSHERAAHCCVRCEAVLVEPKSGTYVPPTDAGSTDTADDADDGGDGGDAAEGGDTDAAAEPGAGAAQVVGSAGGPGEPGSGGSTEVEVAGGNGNGDGPPGS
jgi:hypothetical protein